MLPLVHVKANLLLQPVVVVLHPIVKLWEIVTDMNPQFIGHVWDLKALCNMLQPSALGGDLFLNVRSLGGLPQIHP